MNLTLTQAKEVIGTTTLTDCELEKHTNQFFKWVSEHISLVGHICGCLDAVQLGSASREVPSVDSAGHDDIAGQEMTESYKEQYINYIKAREKAFKYEPQMYGDDGSYNCRDTNSEGELE